MSGRVFVVGSYVAGLTIRADRLPVAGETLVGDEWDDGPGGKGSNQAVQACRMGCTVEMVARIGRDRYGEDAQRLWSTENVGTRHVTIDDEVPTGVAFIMLNRAGDNSILVYPGANSQLSATDVEPIGDELKRHDVVVAQHEAGPDAVARAMQLARRSGSTTILNPAPARTVAPDVLACVDILTPNATEARIMLGFHPATPIHPRTLAQGLLGLGVGTVVLTLGADGVFMASREGEQQIAAVAPPRIVDTTGAGDAFTGTLAAMLASDMTLNDAVRASTAAGALACTVLGVIPALPDLAALQAGGFIAANP